MMAVADRFQELRETAQATNWRGRSGRYYALSPLPLDRFALTGPDLYLLVRGPDVLWIGGEAEIVADAAIRAAFRAALRIANAAFQIPCPPDEIDRLTMAWDLEGAEPVVGLNLA